jgi:enamine deaminase RidA (YjgF/YER057c/UK114 family)
VDETFLVTSVEETHENLEAIFGARAEAYGGIPEVTQTLFGVGELLLPDLKLEIKCIAHL